MTKNVVFIIFLSYKELIGTPRLKLLIIFFYFLFLIPVSVRGESNSDSDSSNSITQRSSLTGEWGGLRTKLADKGVEFELIYTGEMMANVVGGVERHAEYLDNTDLILSIDAEKLVGWKGGSFYLYGLGNWGGSPSLNSGDNQGPSNIEGPDYWQLYEAWYQQKLFQDRLSVLVGFYDVNSEFDVIDTASLFLSSSHGMGPDFSQSGLNGASTYPATSLGIRIRVEPKEWLYIQTVFLDGVPGDLNDPTTPLHVHLSQDEGALIVSEIGVQKAKSKIGLGHWIYTSQFDDLTDAETHQAYGFYLLGEHQFYQESDGQGLSAYARFGYAIPSVHPIQYYLGAGAVYTGLIPSRDEDQLGLGVATAINGSKYNEAQTLLGVSTKKVEVNLELSYRAQILPWFAIQPDLQYILNPGTDASIGNALQIGTRFEIIL